MHEDNNVQIFVQRFAERHKDPYLHVKCTCTVQAPPQTVFKLISNTDSWTKWDPDVKEIRLVSEVQREEGVARTSTDVARITLRPFNPLEGVGLGGSFGKMVPPNALRARDLCAIVHRHESFQEYSSVMHSVAWESCPHQKGIVRAKVRSSGFLVRASKAADGSDDDRTCSVVHVLIIDMNSGAHKQPEFLKNYICEQRPKCLAWLRAHVESGEAPGAGLGEC